MKFGQNLLEILSKYTTFTVLPSSQIRAHSKRPSSRSGEHNFIKKIFPDWYGQYLSNKAKTDEICSNVADLQAKTACRPVPVPHQGV